MVMMRWLWLGICLTACAAAGAAVFPPMQVQQTPNGAGPVPVVVELFTSEGCSSCPPADELLSKLASAQPVAGAQIIALGEHVDYWDHQGWRDQFGSAKFTARQTDYATRVFGPDQVYTPQMVVDGNEQVIGNDAARVTAAIAKAAQRQAHRVTLTLAATAAPLAEHAGSKAERSVAVRVEATVPDDLALKDKADVLIGVTEDDLMSQVRRGENSGRDLHHSAVVRTLIQAGTIPNGTRTWSVTQPVKVPASWNPAHLHIIAVVQDRATRRVLGASISTLGSV